MKIVCTIEARMRSSRLPGKVLLPVLGRPLLAHMIERLRRASRIDAIVIATTTDPSCDPIEALARELGVGCYRGSEDDVLDRVLRAARSVDADIIVETTGDCPLIDPKIVDRVIGGFLSSDGADYATNTLVPNYLRGTDVEVFPRAVLEAVAETTTDPADREHVSLHIYEHPERFRLLSVPNRFAAPENLRLTVDTPEDFALVESIFEALYPTTPDFGTDDILALIAARPELMDLNGAIRQKAVRATAAVVPARRPSGPGPGLKAAVIGCGLIGSAFAATEGVGVYTHAGAFVANSETILVGVCDRDPARADAAAAKWETTAFSDAAALLAETRPDIVSVCTPDASHFDLVKMAIEAPSTRAVLAEKPLACDADRARELVRLADANGVLLAVNYSRRFAPSHTAVKNLIAGGGIGAVQSVSGFYTKGIRHNGTHWLDLARFWCGEIAWIRGDANANADDEDDPTVDVSLGFVSGARGHLTGLDAHAFTLFEIDVVGTAGRIRAVDSGHRIEIAAVAPSARYAGYRELVPIVRPPKAISGDLSDLLLHAVNDVVRCLGDGGTPRCSGRDGVATLALADAAIGSARRGGCKTPVNLPTI